MHKLQTRNTACGRFQIRWCACWRAFVDHELAERVVNRLMLDPQDRTEVLELFPVKRARVCPFSHI